MLHFKLEITAKKVFTFFYFKRNRKLRLQEIFLDSFFYLALVLNVVLVGALFWIFFGFVFIFNFNLETL